jgi:hypothetical protein
MLTTLHDEAIVPCTYVVADCLYGTSPEFLEVLDRFVDCVSMVASIGPKLIDG